MLDGELLDREASVLRTHAVPQMKVVPDSAGSRRGGAWRLGSSRTRIPTQVALACAGAALLLAVAAVIAAASFSSEPAELLRSFAELTKALAWPAAVALIVTAFRGPLSAQMHRVSKISALGGSIELERVVDQELKDAESGVNESSSAELGAVTFSDLDRARAIQGIATDDDLPEIRNRMLGLATQYRQIRGNIPRGDERTRAMAVVVAQMRSLGQAAFPLRGELAFSDDPGRRLAALAIAQVQPDVTMLGWIASRIGPPERPFVQYQAIQALLIAARNADLSHAVNLRQAYRIAIEGYGSLPEERRAKRPDLVEEIGKEVERLSGTSPDTKSREA